MSTWYLVTARHRFPTEVWLTSGSDCVRASEAEGLLEVIVGGCRLVLGDLMGRLTTR